MEEIVRKEKEKTLLIDNIKNIIEKNNEKISELEKENEELKDENKELKEQINKLLEKTKNHTNIFLKNILIDSLKYT
ncbi:10831_t:CDS:1, partial [Racocetra persica]